MFIGKLAKESRDFKGGKTLGVQIPESLFQAISAYALANGKTKSKVVRDLLVKWQKREGGLDASLSQLIEFCKKEYQIRKLNGFYAKHPAPFKQFKSEVVEILKTKGLSEEQVNKVLKQIEHGTDF
jgi:uncharacterized protein (DUF2267 family)